MSTSPDGDKILLAHGSGGQASHKLIADLFLSRFANDWLNQLDDSAVLDIADSSERLAFTTDSYVVRPLFFPGGNIGKLAVCGTVNDLSMSGAVPLYLSAGFIIEEGLLLADLTRIVETMADTARQAGVHIVTGDTKVVERGSADGLFINTAGVGTVPAGIRVSGRNVRPGDAVLLSGSVGDHGMAVMSQREGLRFATALESDCAPLNGLVAAMLAAARTLHALRDPTRGGLATTLNEWAGSSSVGIELQEDRIPVRPEVRGACEMLGLDPLYVANEGKLIAAVPPDQVEAVLAAMRGHEHGRRAEVIGQAVADHPGRVVLRTTLGTRRVLNVLAGEQLPRIC
jgi:hydrogenase expression/formation protein HypE